MSDVRDERSMDDLLEDVKRRGQRLRWKRWSLYGGAPTLAACLLLAGVVLSTSDSGDRVNTFGPADRGDVSDDDDTTSVESGDATPRAETDDDRPGRPRSGGDAPRRGSDEERPPAVGAGGTVAGEGGDSGDGGELRVAVIVNATSSGDSAPPPEGDVSEQTNDRDERTMRTLRAAQRWVDARARAGGRSAQLIALVSSGQVGSGGATVERAVKEHRAHVVLVSSAGDGAYEVADRLGVALVSGYESTGVSPAPPPTTLGLHWDASFERQAAGTADVLCAQLAGRPPVYNEKRDQTFDYSKPRVFGLTVSSGSPFAPATEQVVRAAAARCGLRFAVVIDRNQGTVAGDPSRMRAAGVTTIVCVCADNELGLSTIETEQSGYWPEWFYVPIEPPARNVTTRSQAQWRHVFGATTEAFVARQARLEAGLQLFHASDPDEELTIRLYDQLRIVANALDATRGATTPTSFVAGARSAKPLQGFSPLDPAGGFGRDDSTLVDDQAFFWWDGSFTENLGDTVTPGAYRLLLGGRRLRIDATPNEQLGWFSDGIVLEE